jgi:DNA-binding CsgD family transcriptional regulator
MRKGLLQERIAMLASDVFKLLEGTADAAFVVTPEGEICFWNHPADELFGYSAAETLNKTCHEILNGKCALGISVCAGDTSVHHCAVEIGQIPNFDLEVITRSGKRLWVNISTIVFEDTRTQRRFIAHLARDVSEQKKSEEAFAQWLELSKQALEIGDGRLRLAPVNSLSEQERRIMALFSQAKNSGQVAKELGITLATLRNYLHAINQKLRTHNRLEAVLHAIKRGLI